MQAADTPEFVVWQQVQQVWEPVPMERVNESSDTSAMTCLLCARQFKSLDQLKRHNKDSDLHKVMIRYPSSILS